MLNRLNRSARWKLTRWMLIAMPCMLAVPAVAGAADAPAAVPVLNGLSGDWPGFQGGGSLRGEAKAIDAKPLAKRWQFKHDEAGAFQGSPAIVGQFVYIADVKGRVFCLHLADGSVKWTYAVKDGSFETTPLVLNGRVYIGDGDGLLHCIEASSGKMLWKHDAKNGQPIHASANAAGDKVIIYGNDGSEVIAVDAIEGKELWKMTTGDRVNATPAVGNGLSFVSGCDMKLHAIDVATGKEKFASELGSVAPGSPSVLPDRIVVGLDGGRVVCIAADGSKQLWSYEDIKDKAMVYSSPAVAEGVVVIGARDRQVHAINLADGTKKWQFATRGDVDSSPIIAGGRVYVGSRDKKLYVLDLQTGKSLGEFQAGRGIEAAPAVGQGVVVVADTSGGVYCLEPR